MIDNQLENLQSLREYLQQESCQPQERSFSSASAADARKRKSSTDKSSFGRATGYQVSYHKRNSS